jgi:hypothetical protein
VVTSAYTGLRTGREVAAMPIAEDSELRAERYPYRGTAAPVPDYYGKPAIEQLQLCKVACQNVTPQRYGG